MNPVRLIVYSDYLRPWCYPAAVRLHRLSEPTWPDLVVESRAFPLRLAPEPGAQFTGTYRERAGAGAARSPRATASR